MRFLGDLAICSFAGRRAELRSLLHAGSGFRITDDRGAAKRDTYFSDPAGVDLWGDYLDGLQEAKPVQ